MKPKDIWAIGDVHGCHVEFRELCQKIKNETSHATIYQLGDLIDRGPGLKEVIDVCIDVGVIAIMGNHEWNFLHEVINDKPCRSKSRQRTHEQFQEYDEQTQKYVIDYLKRCNNMERVGWDNGIILSHSIPTKQFFHSSVNTISMCGFNSDPCTKHFPKSAIVVHGHQHWNYINIESQLKDKSRQAFNIDSGCCYGEWLTALRLDFRKVLQVEAKEIYAT